MKTIDLYNLNEGLIPSLAKGLKNKPATRNRVLRDSLRLVYNLNSLLQSFPNSSPDKKLEIKLVVFKLQKLISEIQDSLKTDLKHGKFRLTNS